ncbi:TonB-dependent receptor [Dokdonella sp. MW10]|uniref:TonB-dependent receptor n=1 Tax=Dokdonella sp. MW10 TaxID=2992926 RepID=UPI003F820F2C
MSTRHTPIRSITTRPRPRAITLAVLGALAASAVAQAQPALPSDGDELPAVTVIGITPLPGAALDKDQIAAPVQIATGEEIARSNAIDLTAYMNRTLGSVYVNDIQNNPLQPDINYRGYTASPLLGTPQGLSVYLDGVRLNQPFGDVVSWDLIPRAAITSMALMPGSNPLFGLNTLGGALSIRTKDGFSAPGAAIQLGYGSDSRHAGEFEIGGHADSGVHGYLTGNQLKDDGWRDDSPTDAKQLFGKIGWRNDSTDISLTGAWADTDLTGNGLQEQRFLERDYASVYTKPDNTTNRSDFLNLAATHRFNDTLSFSGNAWWRRIETTTYNGDINEEALEENVYQPSAAEREALAAAGYTGFPVSGETAANTPFPYWRCIANVLLNDEPNEKCNGLINRTATNQIDRGVSGQFTLDGSFGDRRNVLVFGASANASHSRFKQTSQFGYLSPDRGVVGVDGPGAFADGTQDSENAFDARVDLGGRTRTWSMFASDTIELAPALALTVSGRYDRTRVKNRDAITPGGEPGSLDGDHTFDRFNPAVGLTFAPSEAWSAYVGYNEGSRAPSAIELGCADPENPCRLPNSMAGDPPLEQVVTKTIEAGMRGDAGGFAWNAGVFRADNHDDIMFVSDEQAGFGYFRNFGETRRQGVELGASTQLGAFRLGANYTFLDATYRSEEEVNGEGNSSNEEGNGFEGAIEIEPGDRIPLVPRHLFKASVQWDVTERFTLDADMIALSGVYARGNENNQHEPDGLYYLGKGKTGGYAVTNLGASFRPTPSLTVFAQVNNVFDRQYYTAAQLAATGFTDDGSFIARPFSGPVVDGERPLRHATFYAPGAPRAFWVGVRYAFY